MSDKTSPKSSLRLEWVYGYRGHQCRNNLCYNASRELVYFVAGVGIVYNVADHKQRFFLGHSDDIVSLTIHPDNVLIATGQVGKSPYICVWDSMTVQTVSILKDGHEHGISAMGFNKDGSRLVSVGLDQSSVINVWDWRKGKILATVKGHSDRVFDIQYSFTQENTIVSCGVKHIKFWSLSGNTLTAKKGVFGKVGEIQTMLCLAFGAGDITYSGTLSGDVYIWKANNLSQVVKAAHGGSVFALYGFGDGYISGGKDGCVKFWNKEFKPMNMADLTQTPQGYKGLVIRSVYCLGDRVLVGTQDSEIFEIPLRDQEKPQCLVTGHAEGELWALAVNPKKQMFATGSDDRTVRIWNMQNNCIQIKSVLDKAIRSCAFSPDGMQLAVGMMDGSFSVLLSKDLQEVIHIKDRKEVIHEMKYSPDGTHLAVGSNDNFVDIYSVAQKYKKVGQCSGSSSFITHLDWSEDSKYIQTNSGAAERLFFKLPNGKQVTSAEELRSISWATFTGVLGPEVCGIWEKYTDTNDVNATDAHFKAGVIVTGDDFGLVKLFRFPSLKKGAKFKKYVGHSAHVTNCRFSADKSCVLTIGGADHAIFQWQYLPDGTELDSRVENGCVDSDSEDSDSDLSDVPEVDSDLEREKEKSYNRDIYKEDAVVVRKKNKAETKAAPGDKKQTAPQEGLQLQFVHGYRGFDCRNNVFYLRNGEIVYHTAAVGIVYSKEKHVQRFYLEHTDDILCLCIHPLKDIIATGQVGRDPTIHVWDAETLKSYSILKGQHQRGVCACDFSSDGKKLASVGLDDEHCIVVWDWRKGEKLATTRGHKGKIFVIKWNPFDVNKLVTVGDKHIKFWVQAGSGFTSNRGVFGNAAKQDTMLCAAYGKTVDTCFTGGANGSIYVWTGNSLSKCIPSHKGPCFAMHFMDKGFVTGGKDGVVSLWDEQFERCLKSYGIKQSAIATGTRAILTSDSPAIRAAVLGHGHILVGTVNAEIIEVTKEGVMTILTQGHCEGELWGLATHPTKLFCATASDDCSIRLWDLTEKHRMVNRKILKKPASSVAFSPDGKALAVGFRDGSVVVFNSDSLDEIVQFHHRKEAISDIKFSPDPGKYLAVGSHDNFIDIYNVLTSQHVGVCKGASSYVTHIDWDIRGKLIMLNSGAKEVLFFEAPRGTRQTPSASEVEKMSWATFTGVLGATCEGIWPPASDVTDMNASCLTKDKKLLATGDDFGFVKLFDYPVKGKHAKFKKYVGHCAHVTNVRWSVDDVVLTSIGGADTSLLVWSHGAKGYSGESEDSDTDDEADGGYDSDVEQEKNIDYSSKFNTDPIRDISAVKPSEQKYEVKEKQACSRNVKSTSKVATSSDSSVMSQNKTKTASKVTDLELELILGYRGFDCCNNLQYLNDGADVVYCAAGAGIVLNFATGSQSFYLEHTDDIICLTVNEHPKFKNVVATGQIGQTPSIHIWNAVTKKNLSILKGFHKKGVCAVDFSCSGKLLLSIGLDENFSVAVYSWQDGSQIATTAGHNQWLFHAEFRPDSDSSFVSVGIKHIKFWNLAGNTAVGKKGIIAPLPELNGQKKMLTFLSIAFGTNNVTYAGAISGDIYMFKEVTLSRVIPKAHQGPIFSMFTTLSDGLIVTGAKEKIGQEGGQVKLWDQEMKRCRAFQLQIGQSVDKHVVVKSVSRIKGKIVVGTKMSEFVEISEKSGEMKLINCGHGDGELWGLAVHPTTDKFVTASADNTVRLWDITAKKMINMSITGSARSCDISPDGELIAVGLNNGGFMLLVLSTFKVFGQRRDRGKPITAIRFSPNGVYLAIGSEESCVDFYDLTKGSSLQRIGYCTAQSFILSIDFSIDSKMIRVSTGAYVNQIFEVPTGTEVKDSNKISKLVCSSWMSICGSEVVGIWPKEAGTGHVNCADVSHSGDTIVSGDDFGLVRLFDFPCHQKDSSCKTYVGHSAHVTNVRFTFNDRYLISAGGDDCCVFIWRCKLEKNGNV